MERRVRVIQCEATDRERWNRFVVSAQDATLCHQYDWRTVIERAYGHQTIYLAATLGDEIEGILPLVVFRMPWRGATLVSMPFMDYGGICATDSAITQRLLEEAVTLMPEMGCSSLELRHQKLVGCQSGAGGGKVTMVLDLTPGSEALWRALPAKVRNQVRKAEKCGLSICVGGGELLDDFYKVFAINMRDLGSPVHDVAFFRTMIEVFDSQVRISLVRDGKRTVGGLVALFHNDTMLVPWASALREDFAKCPNNLLYWEAIQEGGKRGCKHFDFGRSTVGSGTYDFKKQWGAQPVQLHWQTIGEGKSRATVQSGDAKYRMVVSMWKRLPVGISRLVGPHLRKYLAN